MWFNSLTFAVFIAVVYSLYRVLPHRGQNIMLLVASYVFYGAWDWRFLSLILLSTFVDYFIGLALVNSEGKRRRLYLLISVFTNLGLLATFKYFGFFSDSLRVLLSWIGFDAGWTTIHIVLPVGISFYTFQTMSYTIDIYREKIQPTSRFLDFALFVAFFPQLVAGPIERASNLLPQIANPRTLTFEQTTRGFYLILFGLFKKVAIADGVANSVNAVYGSTGTLSGIDIILACYLFTIQIYCDFSGYSDIARGLAKIMGIELMTNFRTPYFAINPSEVWRRWHISLSSWLRDYLYISLGGNRNGEFKTYRNLMITMALGGLWHGNSWNFALWGVFHGSWLSLHRMLTSNSGAGLSVNPSISLIKNIIKMFLCWHAWCYSLVLFRAVSLEQVVTFSSFWTFDFANLSVSMPRPTFGALAGLLVLLPVEIIEYLKKTPLYYRGWPAVCRGAYYAVLLFLTIMGLSNEPAQFIYFQF